MDLDYGRKLDLEELTIALRDAKSSSAREYYKRLINKIVNESTNIRSLRDNLIKAMRSNDINLVRRFEAQIQYARLAETKGQSWGNQKKEKEKYE